MHVVICVLFCQQGTEHCTQHEDCSRAVEASERVGGALWLRCRVALLRCVLVQASDVTVPNPGQFLWVLCVMLRLSVFCFFFSCASTNKK